MHPDAAHIPPARTGSYPPREGNLLRPLIDGPAAFGRIAEAVESAKHSVWVTLAFHEAAFRFPGGRGSLIDLLAAAAARGIDVRGLFWREENLDALVSDSEIFAGTEDERAELERRGFGARLRWDCLPDFCHHQKSWVIDAGHPEEIAFVGGINLDRGSLSPRGHAVRAPQPGVAAVYAEIHDLYAELRGPCTTDVVHNFVQRWNEASERDKPSGVFPDRQLADDLPRPQSLAAAAGDATVQITRTIMPGVYRDGTPPPDATPYAVAEGEASVREQVLAAIAHAKRTIHIENQIFLSKAVLHAVAEALERGVLVNAIVPRIPMKELIEYRSRHPEVAAPIFEGLERCATHEGFTFAGLAAPDKDGTLVDVYVHAKIMLVDDAWATIGSTNFMGRSFFQETEMNASVWCPDTVRALREDLFDEHLGGASARLAEREAYLRFAEMARANAPLFAAGEPLSGLAHQLDAETWCLEPQGSAGGEEQR